MTRKTLELQGKPCFQEFPQKQGLGGWLAWSFHSRLKTSIPEGDLEFLQSLGPKVLGDFATAMTTVSAQNRAVGARAGKLRSSQSSSGSQDRACRNVMIWVSKLAISLTRYRGRGKRFWKGSRARGPESQKRVENGAEKPEKKLENCEFSIVFWLFGLWSRQAPGTPFFWFFLLLAERPKWPL